MEKKPVEVKSLKEGGFVIIDDIPCKVTDISISKPGKHGSAKAKLTAVGLFETAKKIIVKGKERYRLHIGRTYTAFYMIDERQKIVRVVEILPINQAHKKYGY